VAVTGSNNGRSTATRVGLAACAVALFALGAVAAWRIPIPTPVPSVAWNSTWVFRGEVFVATQLAAYALVMLYASIVAGTLLGKVGFGPFSFERQAQAALSDGRDALAAARNELQRQIQSVADAGSNLRGLVMEATSDQPNPETIRRLRQSVQGDNEQLTALLAARDSEFEAAMRRLDTHLGNLSQLLEKRPRSGNGQS
jgi:hypothetical protein